MLVRYKVRFLLHRRHPGDEKNLQIRMRVTIHGKTPCDVPTGLHVDVVSWDTEKGRETTPDGGFSAINKTLDEWENIVTDIFARYEYVEKRIPDTSEFRDLFLDTIGRPTRLTRMLDEYENPDFFRTFDQFVREQGTTNQWTHGTFEKFHAIREHLHTFDKKLSFQTLDESKMRQYVQYLTKRGYINTTMAKNLSFVRWFLRWAHQHGYYGGNLHETFKPRLKGTSGECKEIIYLSRDELSSVMDHQFPPNESGLERVRDVFLFCCFTGLRYSDVAKLRRTDVRDDCIVVTTKKTRDNLHIELNRHSRAILDKYAGHRFKGDLALPVISNVKMNAALKRVGIECGLNTPTRITCFQGANRIEQVLPKWQLLTTHVGRRTFVVTALTLGVPAEIIMKWTGHSDYKAMKPYVAIVDELKRTSMSRFDSL